MAASVPRLCRSAARSAPSAPSSNVCPQLPNLDGFNLGTSNTEDCLYLNVFTQVGYARKHSGRPVMVWIYGGGLIAGEANDYNASKLVTQGRISDQWARIRQMARDAGRDRQTLPVTLFNPAEDEGELARYRDMGVARVVPMLLSEERDKILPILDRWATLIRRTAH